MTTSTGFRLLPDDVLFFRDGKPSAVGADHYLRSLFPPYPSTLYGALRTRRLLDSGVSLRELARDPEATWSGLLGDCRREVGEWAQFGTLRLRGPWLLSAAGEVLLPAPEDLAVVARDAQEPSVSKLSPTAELPPTAERVLRVSPQEIPGGASHSLLPWVSSDPKALDEAGSASEWFVTPSGLAAWSRGETPPPETLCHRASLWGDEPRTGVGLEESSRSAADGMLYTFGTIRLRPGVSLGFETRGTRLEPRGLLRLGGERKTAELGPGPPLPALAGLPVAPGDLLTMAFVTPAVSRTGSYPPGFGPESPEGTVEGARLRLVAAAATGPLPVGGWDMARGAPKPLRRAIPPGSVFCFECLDEPAATVAAHLHGACLSDDPDLALQGFGLVVCGRRPAPQPPRRTPDGQ